MKAVLTLASSSPRRRELLALGGWMFRILPVDVDETPHAGEDPAAYVVRLAAAKAAAAVGRLNPGGVAVAADTTVADGGAILGKPEGPVDAAEMLWRLRGRAHQVHTAIAVQRPGDPEPLTDVCTTTVPMRNYSDEEMFAYIQTGDPFDKAGAYAIQHKGFHPVDSLSGCYANVVGLPLCHLVRLLRRINLAPRADVPEACQRALDYDCDIHPQILGWIE